MCRSAYVIKTTSEYCLLPYTKLCKVLNQTALNYCVSAQFRVLIFQKLGKNQRHCPVENVYQSFERIAEIVLHIYVVWLVNFLKSFDDSKQSCNLNIEIILSRITIVTHCNFIRFFFFIFFLSFLYYTTA